RYLDRRRWTDGLADVRHGPALTVVRPAARASFLVDNSGPPVISTLRFRAGMRGGISSADRSGATRRATKDGRMADATTTVGALKDAAGAFAADRHWEPFHTPKNLAMALACEVGELLEPFRWLTGEESVAACQDPAT